MALLNENFSAVFYWSKEIIASQRHTAIQNTNIQLYNSELTSPCVHYLVVADFLYQIGRRARNMSVLSETPSSKLCMDNPFSTLEPTKRTKESRH